MEWPFKLTSEISSAYKGVVRNPDATARPPRVSAGFRFTPSPWRRVQSCSRNEECWWVSLSVLRDCVCVLVQARISFTAGDLGSRECPHIYRKTSISVCVRQSSVSSVSSVCRLTFIRTSSLLLIRSIKMKTTLNDWFIYRSVLVSWTITEHNKETRQRFIEKHTQQKCVFNDTISASTPTRRCTYPSLPSSQVSVPAEDREKLRQNSSNLLLPVWQ